MCLAAGPAIVPSLRVRCTGLRPNLGLGLAAADFPRPPASLLSWTLTSGAQPGLGNRQSLASLPQTALGNISRLSPRPRSFHKPNAVQTSLRGEASRWRGPIW